jgi:4-diphosphocytidyl-2-C-methyl-D-erythritol kinase
MQIDRRRVAVRARAPAKVNLFLEVRHRRADGYHDLATLMTAVSLYDTLEFTDDPSGAVRLACDHPGLSTGPDNLVCRAADLLRRRTGHPGGAGIRLWKRIPLAAGLAGGSSDAAATLAGLNRLWRLGLGKAELAGLGAELGSDVAFFFATPAAWCTGRGERVEPLTPGRTLDLVLVCPPVGLSTARVFGGLTVPAQPRDGAALRQAFVAGDVEQLGRLLYNRLQPVAESLCPEVAAASRRLADLGPAGQLMSGSGTTVFALCRGRSEALRVARALDPGMDVGDGTRVCIVRSCV